MCFDISASMKSIKNPRSDILKVINYIMSETFILFEIGSLASYSYLMIWEYYLFLPRSRPIMFIIGYTRSVQPKNSKVGQSATRIPHHT